jgi:hypothetical protein
MSRLLALFLVALAFIGFLATTSYRVPAQNDRRWTKPPRSIEREPGSPRGVLNGDVRRPSSASYSMPGPSLRSLVGLCSEMKKGDLT